MADEVFTHASPLAGAGVLFFDADDRVLLVRTTYKTGYEIPGGVIEPGETPFEAATREVEEELGIRPPIGDLLVADWAPSKGEDRVLFVFDGGILAAAFVEALRLDPGEIAGYEFCDRDRMAEVTVDRMTRRLDAAFSARASGRTLYLEHGVPLVKP